MVQNFYINEKSPLSSIGISSSFPHARRKDTKISRTNFWITFLPLKRSKKSAVEISCSDLNFSTDFVPIYTILGPGWCEGDWLPSFRFSGVFAARFAAILRRYNSINTHEFDEVRGGVRAHTRWECLCEGNTADRIRVQRGGRRSHLHARILSNRTAEQGGTTSYPLEARRRRGGRDKHAQG